MSCSLTALPDGQLAAEQLVTVPFMAPRLQGELTPNGRLDISLWGAGRLGAVRVSLGGGPVVIAPNRAIGRGWSLHVAQSAPVLVVKGGRHLGLHPAKRCAPWDTIVRPLAAIVREEERCFCRLAWGHLVSETRGADLVVAAGQDAAEVERALSLSVETIIAEGEAHVARCDALPKGDPILRSLVLHGAHAGLSSIRQDVQGQFAGLSAGLAYSSPSRTYYRDGYWTLPLLLQLDPPAARAQIDLLAEGVHPDGEAPSGLILGGPQQSRLWEDRRLSLPGAAQTHQHPRDWWSDHFDSPLFFVLALGDYASATGDTDLARAHWPVVKTIFERYRALSAGPDGLPLKPRNDRDWADNVYREGVVAYDTGLWVGALEVIQWLGRDHDPATADTARELQREAGSRIERALRRGETYADYVRGDGSDEPHLTLDSLTLLRYGAVSGGRAETVLEAVRARLQTRHNGGQPYGDWGMLCAFPPYSRRSDLRAKSAFPYRYHNGGDWPWLDGVYAQERLRRGLDGWRYPLMRWWESCLANGWAGAVEHFSPPFGRGSLLQAWSSLPAAVALMWSGQVLAGDPDEA